MGARRMRIWLIRKVPAAYTHLLDTVERELITQAISELSDLFWTG